VAELLQTIAVRLGANHGAISKLRIIVAESLGETLSTAMDWRFDMALAMVSTHLYDAATIPAIRPPLPAGVSALRFTSEIAGCAPLDVNRLERLLDPSEAALLPAPAR
jgi:hypothetical protein